MTGIKLALAAAILSIASNGFAITTDQTRYQKIWRKNVSSDRSKPKLSCLCATGALGALMFPPRSDGSVALCLIPTFGSDGSLTGQSSCDSNFVVLPK